MVLVDSHCPDAARSAPRSSAIRFGRHAAPNEIESLRGFPSKGDDIGDAADGESFLLSSWTLVERRAAGTDEIEIVGNSQKLPGEGLGAMLGRGSCGIHSTLVGELWRAAGWMRYAGRNDRRNHCRQPMETAAGRKNGLLLHDLT